MSNIILPNDGHVHAGVRDRLPTRGRWRKVFVWHNEDDYQAYKRGNFVIPKLWFAADNGITDVGIHYLLDAGFRNQTQIATWYGGLIDAAGFTGVNGSDTMASHTGWSESTAYTETNRPTFVFPAAAGRSISDEISFTMNATVTIQGIFVPDENTKGGATGTLWSTAEFSSPPGLISGNVLTANYTLSD